MYAFQAQPGAARKRKQPPVQGTRHPRCTSVIHIRIRYEMLCAAA
jgi:hypothetical protein